MRRSDNTGFYVVRPRDYDCKTVVVSGVGRSGTTALMRALHATGLPKTGKRTSSTQDDYMIGESLSDRSKLESVCAGMNDTWLKWGTKFPLVWQHKENLKAFTRPVYLMMIRDKAAVAYRAWTTASKTKSYSYWFKQVHLWEEEMMEWVFHYSMSPIALISYEKLLLQPVTMMRQVTSFCGMKFDIKCADEIIPQDERYVNGMGFHNCRFADDNDN